MVEVSWYFIDKYSRYRLVLGLDVDYNLFSFKNSTSTPFEDEIKLAVL